MGVPRETSTVCILARTLNYFVIQETVFKFYTIVSRAQGSA